MIKKHLQKNIINRKLCICKSKLKQKINFGNLPLINSYKTKKSAKSHNKIQLPKNIEDIDSLNQSLIYRY